MQLSSGINNLTSNIPKATNNTTTNSSGASNTTYGNVNPNINIPNTALNTITNNTSNAMNIQGSGQTLNPGSTLVLGNPTSNIPSVIETPANYNNAYYTTSLNTTHYGSTIGSTTALSGSGSYNGIPTTLSGTSGSVQSTSNGFYKVITSNGSVVYTNINPNG